MTIASITTEGFVSDRVNGLMDEGFSTYTGLREPPLTGWQYKTCTTTSWTGNSIQAGSVPPVAVSDILITETATSPSSYTVQLNSDGTVNILASGDTSRQKFGYQVFRVASNTLDGSATVWVNEVAPIWKSIPAFPPLQIAQSIAPFNFASYVNSPAGDTLSFAVASGTIPAGLTLSGFGVLSGTPSVATNYSFMVSALDTTGTSSTSAANNIVVYISVSNVTIPNVTGLSLADAIAAAQAASVVIISIVRVYSQTVPFGIIAGQSPIAGSTSNTLIMYESIGPSVVQEEHLH